MTPLRLGFLTALITIQFGCGGVPSDDSELSVPEVNHPSPISQNSEADDKKIIKEDGWAIPVLTPEIVVKEGSRQIVGNISVKRTKYRLQQDFFIAATRKISRTKHGASGPSSGLKEITGCFVT